MSIIYNVRSSDSFVYHYTSARTAAKFILRDRRLKLGSFATTNDPRESKSWKFGAWSIRSANLDRVQLEELSSKFSASLKLAARVACFCSDQSPLSGDHVTDILLRGFARSRMWAQYAENHTGACLVFDKSKLLKRIEEQFSSDAVFHGCVNYKNQCSFPKLGKHEFTIDLDAYLRQGYEQYVESHLAAHHRALFFEKLEDWRDEREWRVVIRHESDNGCFLSFQDSLVGVIHGTAMSPKMSRQLINLADEPTIEHMGLIWNNPAPWYDLGGMHWNYEDRKFLRRIRTRARRSSATGGL